MWFLMTFPQKSEYSVNYTRAIEQAESANRAGTLSDEELASSVRGYENAMASEGLAYSFAGRIGKIIEPLIKPLGFDWRLGIALFSGFAAKETVISTMATVYGLGEVDEGSESLRQSLAEDPRYNPLTAFAFLVFMLLYVPCMSAMVVFLRESGSWKELAFQLAYTTALAWGLSFAVYQVGLFLGLGG
jgi:ferrous iron transport protein B